MAVCPRQPTCTRLASHWCVSCLVAARLLSDERAVCMTHTPKPALLVCALQWEMYTGGRAFEGMPRALLGHQIAKVRASNSWRLGGSRLLHVPLLAPVRSLAAVPAWLAGEAAAALPSGHAPRLQRPG